MKATISKGTSLSVEQPEEVLISPNRVFSAGFYSVGVEAFCFAIWFSKLPSHQNSSSRTVVWMANRDQPVNGRHSKLSLLKTGDLILTDAGKFHCLGHKHFLTFLSTVISLQHRNTKLVSSRSHTNISSGFYELFFDNDNILSLLFNGLEVSSIYWPEPWLKSWEAGRSTYNNSRIAVLNSLGNFSSSDDFTFKSTDYGAVLHRRLTLDYDGNIRLYSWEEEGQIWVVSWQAIQRPCRIHGACGANSLCSYAHNFDRKCSCLKGFKMKNRTDWSYGCVPEFHFSRNKNETSFVLLSHVEYYGYDYRYTANFTFNQCRNLCLQLRECKAFQYSFQKETGFSHCFPKTQLLNGYYSPSFEGDTYLKLPKSYVNNFVEEFSLDCSRRGTIPLVRTYVKNRVNGTVKFMLWFACGVGGLELICIFVVWCLLIRTQKSFGADKQGYGLAATGFRKFSYAELKKATKGFTEEIGKGAWGAVYKGVLSNNQIAAIKRLYEANEGEDVFLAEKSLSSNALDWKQRFEIALGTARGLAYLHEECLEWVLHCDVKPQNILLDSNYQPKVADFGLSKLQNRGDLNNPNFSKIRGTRGYMAPEWVFNLPITSKVDVYSYGIVVLEMVTGKNTIMGVHDIDVGVEAEHKRLVTWVRETKNGKVGIASWIEHIIDPKMEGRYDMGKMEILAEVALQCVEEDKDARPTMSQVVEMLLRHENDHH
uniref:Uncharacterized protein n=1 Tax=Fagus sylvatica TaxID=28930 RepID=A0A2N9FE46_FAGSY